VTVGGVGRVAVGAVRVAPVGAVRVAAVRAVGVATWHGGRVGDAALDVAVSQGLFRSRGHASSSHSMAPVGAGCRSGPETAGRGPVWSVSRRPHNSSHTLSRGETVAHSNRPVRRAIA